MFVEEVGVSIENAFRVDRKGDRTNLAGQVQNVVLKKNTILVPYILIFNVRLLKFLSSRYF